MLNALSGIASRLRVQLGESMSTLDEHNRPLPDVGTGSIDALKAYTAGLESRVTNQGRLAALEQFKRAVEIDDGFAIAHAQLGTSYSFGSEAVLGIRHTTRAFELRERTTDNEKFFITATYHRQVTGNLEQALQTFDYLDRLDEAAAALQRAADRKVSGPDLPPGIFTSRSSEGTTPPWSGSSCGPRVVSANSC